MASKCVKRWKSVRRPSTGGAITEIVRIESDVNGVLQGEHEDSGKGVGGECLETGMTWYRPDDGTFPRYEYEGGFLNGDEDHVRGTYKVISHAESGVDIEAGGDWEADKTGTD